MKRAKKISAFLLMFSLVGLASCSIDDNDVYPDQPVKVEDINGEYFGRLITVQGRMQSGTNTTFTVKESVMTFKALPVREIVGSVVEDEVAKAEAIKAIGDVKYNVDFTASLHPTNTAVLLVFTPKSLELDIPVGGVNKKVIATFKAERKGVYTSNRINSLKFELSVDKLTVDGVDLSNFETIKYVFPQAIKK